MMLENIGLNLMSNSKFYMGYSRWLENENRYEKWEESITRVMDMHRTKYKDKLTPELSTLIDKVQKGYDNKLVLGAQRALQYGGEQIFQHNARMYNCSSTYVDRPRVFQEIMYMLLCGSGVGASVQKQHIVKLPKIEKRGEEVKVFTIPDSIEGWADAFGVLLSSYFIEGGTFPEYKGKIVHFDYSQIRPKGAHISGGFKAPGPDGLRIAIQKTEELLEATLKEESPRKVEPITAYDFIMHMSDAVLSGGVRRSASIILFSKDDESMLKAKTGDWFVDNPQRARSNNSVVLKRDELTRDEWKEIMKSVRQVGEPGFVFVEDLETLYNPLTEEIQQAA